MVKRYWPSVPSKILKGSVVESADGLVRVDSAVSESRAQTSCRLREGGVLSSPECAASSSELVCQGSSVDGLSISI